MRQEAKIKILRFISALIAGFALSFAFMYLLANVKPRAFESLGEFIGRMLGLGFEGAVVELLVIMIGSASIFSIASWLILRSWGPMRHRSDE